MGREERLEKWEGMKTIFRNINLILGFFLLMVGISYLLVLRLVLFFELAIMSGVFFVLAYVIHNQKWRKGNHE